jgi:outer membrane protein OmpA-like peptidoglycan-associated protein
MQHLFFIPFLFWSTLLIPVHLLSNNNEQVVRPSITIVTDPSWDVSGSKTYFGEYPLSAELIASATSPLYGGTSKAVIAESNLRSKIIPGSIPIWRNRTADSEREAYQFRKNIQLGADPIRKVMLEVNCDDVSRIYINKRLVSANKRDGKLKDGWDIYSTFRSVTGFMYDRIYTYDVTDYFFTHVTNTIIAEAESMAFDGSHAYFSAKIVIEFNPMPEPLKVTTSTKHKAVTETKSRTQTEVGKIANLDKTIFEAGRDPGIDKLEIGSILELGNVYFKTDDYHLDATTYRTLDALVTFMKRNPGLKIEVGGHTNLRPNEQFAAELSANRAYAVMRYLIDKGIAINRVSHKGYGKSQPRMKAISKEADRANQRVEVKVMAR